MKKSILALLLFVPSIVFTQLDYSSNSIINEDIIDVVDFEANSAVLSIQLMQYHSINNTHPNTVHKQESYFFTNGFATKIIKHLENFKSEANFIYNDKMQLIKSSFVASSGIKEAKEYTYQNDKIKTMSFFELSKYNTSEEIMNAAPDYVLNYDYKSNYIVKSVGSNSYQYEIDEQNRIINYVNGKQNYSYKYNNESTYFNEIYLEGRKKTYTYNKKGHLECLSEYNITNGKEKLYNKYFYTYVYDERGNWIERKTYDGTFYEDLSDIKLLTLKSITKRKITYTDRTITGTMDLK